MLADRLKARLEELGMTQSELARRSRLSVSYVSDLVHNRRGRRMSHATMVKLKRALRVKSDFFVDECSVKTDDDSTNGSEGGARA